MSAKLLKGAEVAKEIRAELKVEVQALQEKHGVVPGLVTILVGENPASQSYVRAKQNTAHELGFYSVQDSQPVDLSEEALLKLIDKYNKDPKIDGILVQLPLPKHVNENRVLLAIDPGKDVDAFHPVNVGKLMIGEPIICPAPLPASELLCDPEAHISGAEVVVVGRSNIVGKPIAMMLMQKAPGANATVTVHTPAPRTSRHTACARTSWSLPPESLNMSGRLGKTGAVVIDVGVNEVGKAADGETESSRET